jgi:hypothetical protein
MWHSHTGCAHVLTGTWLRLTSSTTALLLGDEGPLDIKSRNVILQQAALDSRLEAWQLQGLGSVAGMWHAASKPGQRTRRGVWALANRADDCAGRET